MTTTETPLNQVAIKCHRCQETIASFDQWFQQPCNPTDGTDAAYGGHDLHWPEIMLLQFRTKAESPPRRAA